MIKEIEDQNVCVMGLGYVGLTLAVTLADVGFNVYGIEIRDEVLEKLKNGKPHFFEPGLEEKLKKVLENNRFNFFKNIPADKDIDVFFITVGTPLGDDGISRMDMIKNVIREVSRFMKEGSMLILRSTVKLGVTNEIVLPEIKKSVKEFDLAFCPERTLEGKALVELRYLPQIIGGINNKSTIRAAKLFQFITPTVVKVSNVETAEMIKLIDNTSRDVHFAFSNEVAKICDGFNVSAIEVIKSGKLGYPRTDLAIPGLVGGPCLEKDPYILMEGLRKYGIETNIINSSRKMNEEQVGYTIEFLKSLTLENNINVKKISLLGIAFKGRPETNDLRGTMAEPIFEKLKVEFLNTEFYGFDAVVEKDDIENFGLKNCSNLDKAFENSELVIILNNHIVFEMMNIEKLSSLMSSNGYIYDFWNLFSIHDLELKNQVKYVAAGSHNYCLNKN